jgi:hypothetical protein
MLDIIDMDGLLRGDEEHVSGWDLVYDNGFIEIDPEQCGYTTFLGSTVPTSAETETESEPPVTKEGRDGLVIPSETAASKIRVGVV